MRKLELDIPIPTVVGLHGPFPGDQRRKLITNLPEIEVKRYQIALAFIFGVVTTVAALLLAPSWFGMARKGTSSANSQIGADSNGDAAESHGPQTLGRIEPARGTLDISGTVGDRLGQLKVKEGDLAEAGQVLAYLDSRVLRELEVTSIQSQLKEAKARGAAEENLAEAQRVTAEVAIEKATFEEQQIGVQKEKVDLARASLELAQRDLDAMKELSEELLPKQRLERQVLLVHQAKTELSVARAMHEKMMRSGKLGVSAAKADLAAANANKQYVSSAAASSIRSLENQLEMAKEQLARVEIKAPSDGTVLKIYTRPGETIGARPILKMADLRNMIVVAEVYETDVERINKDQRVTITSKAFPRDHQELEGKVRRIGRMVATPALKHLSPFARADRHVVEVVVAIDQAGNRQAADFVNLQVEVEFLEEAKP